ncbi:MAG: isochorismatase family protein [Synergistaceae bacterium]|jgi:nicotinamidase-related amidase|nr:isochorismatase family protein [Synergistaceae bacterium]
MKKEVRNVLIIVDPQNDFCDPSGALYVEGAAADIERLARHIGRRRGDYSDIIVSLDSHDAVAVFHPGFWLDEGSNHPAPFTSIAPEDYRRGKWHAAAGDNETAAKRLFDTLGEKGAESLTIWPEHCLVSTWGHQIADPLRDALDLWRKATGRPVRYVFKGENPYTDQFSIFEGVDNSWSDTMFNENLARKLAESDTVTFSGEALSHCVEASVSSYVKRLGEIGGREQVIRLLVDCTSPVAGFDGESSLDRLVVLGVEFIRSDS